MNGRGMAMKTSKYTAVYRKVKRRIRTLQDKIGYTGVVANFLFWNGGEK